MRKLNYKLKSILKFYLLILFFYNTGYGITGKDVLMAWQDEGISFGIAGKGAVSLAEKAQFKEFGWENGSFSEIQGKIQTGGISFGSAKNGNLEVSTYFLSNGAANGDADGISKAILGAGAIVHEGTHLSDSETNSKLREINATLPEMEVWKNLKAIYGKELANSSLSTKSLIDLENMTEKICDINPDMLGKIQEMTGEDLKKRIDGKWVVEQKDIDALKNYKGTKLSPYDMFYLIAKSELNQKGINDESKVLELQSQLFKNNGSPDYFNQLKDGMVINGSNAISGMGGFGALSINYDIVGQGNKLVLSPNMMNFTGSLANSGGNGQGYAPFSMGKYDFFTEPDYYNGDSLLGKAGAGSLSGLKGIVNIVNNLAGTAIFDIGLGGVAASTNYMFDFVKYITGMKQSDIDAMMQFAALHPVGKAFNFASQYSRAGTSVLRNGTVAEDLNALKNSGSLKNQSGNLDAASNARRNQYWGQGNPELKGNDKSPIWTSNKTLSSAENAYAHWKKHGSKFPGIQNAKEYVEFAKNFTKNPPRGTITKVRANGDKLFYDPKANIFAVVDKYGSPRTIFKPNPKEHGYPTNMDYFNAQK